MTYESSRDGGPGDLTERDDEIFKQRFRRCQAALQAPTTLLPPPELLPWLLEERSKDSGQDERQLATRILTRALGESGADTSLEQAVQRVNFDLEDTSLLEDRARMLCAEVVEDLGFELAGVQIVHPHKNTIETIAGEGAASSWVGVATHELPPKTGPAIRLDIQADIVRSRRGEVVRGDDPRFDPYLFQAFHHAKAVRAWLPLVVVRDVIGRRVRESVPVRWQPMTIEGRLALSPSVPDGYELDVLGTIEAGFMDGESHDIDAVAFERLSRLVTQRAPHLYAATLTAALERIAESVMNLCGSESASLHLLRKPFDVPFNDHAYYTYNVLAGRAAPMSVRAPSVGGGISDPPRVGGLGDTALEKGRPQMIPDPRLDQPADYLKTYNPNIWSVHGVKAMVAFPLISHARRMTEKLGILYVHYFEPRAFDLKVIEQVQEVVLVASNGIRLAMDRNEERERWRQVPALLNLLWSSLNDGPDIKALERMAWNASNLLGADVVGIRHLRHGDPAGAMALTCVEKVRDVLPTSFLEDALKEIMVADRERSGLFAPDVRSPEWLPGANAKFLHVERERLTSAAGQRLVTPDGTTVGGIYLGFRSYRPFEAGEVAVVRTLSALVTSAIEGRPPNLQQIKTVVDDVTKAAQKVYS